MSESFFQQVYSFLSIQQLNYLWKYSKYSILLPMEQRDIVSGEDEEVPLFTFAVYQLNQLVSNKKDVEFTQQLASSLDSLYNASGNEEIFYTYPYQLLLQRELVSLEVEKFIAFFKYYESILTNVGQREASSIYVRSFNFEKSDELKQLDLTAIRVTMYSIIKRREKTQAKPKGGKTFSWNWNEIYLEVIKLQASIAIYSVLKFLKDRKVFLDTKLMEASAFTPNWLQSYIRKVYNTQEIWILHEQCIVRTSKGNGNSKRNTLVWSAEERDRKLKESKVTFISNDLLSHFQSFSEWLNCEEDKDNWIVQLNQDVQETITQLISCRNLNSMFGNWRDMNAKMFLNLFRCLVYNEYALEAFGVFNLDAVQRFLQLSISSSNQRNSSACWTYDAIMLKNNIVNILNDMGCSNDFIHATLLELSKKHYELQIEEGTDLQRITVDKIHEIKSFNEYLHVIVTGMDELLK